MPKFGDVFTQTLTVQKKLILHTPLKANFLGSLQGDVIGTLNGSVIGDVQGDIRGNSASFIELECSRINDPHDGMGIMMENCKFQKGCINCSRLNVGSFLQVDKIIENTENSGISLDGVLCRDHNLSAQNIESSNAVITNRLIGKSRQGDLDVGGVKIRNGRIEQVEYQCNKGDANGYCELDQYGMVPNSRLNSYPFQLCGAWNPFKNEPDLETLILKNGDMYVVTESGNAHSKCWKSGDVAIYSGGKWEQLPAPSTVSSVNNKVGKVSLSIDDFRITEQTGDLLVDNGLNLERLPRGIEGQVLTSTGDSIMWKPQNHGIVVDFTKKISLYNNIPTTMEGWTLNDDGFNDDLCFDLGTGHYTVPMDGRYWIECKISFEKCKFNQMFKVDLIKNSMQVLDQDIRYLPITQSAIAGFEILRISCIRKLLKDDTLSIHVLQTNDGGESLDVGCVGTKSTLSIMKL